MYFNLIKIFFQLVLHIHLKLRKTGETTVVVDQKAWYRWGVSKTALVTIFVQFLSLSCSSWQSFYLLWVGTHPIPGSWIHHWVLQPYQDPLLKTVFMTSVWLSTGGVCSRAVTGPGGCLLLGGSAPGGYPSMH